MSRQPRGWSALCLLFSCTVLIGCKLAGAHDLPFPLGRLPEASLWGISYLKERGAKIAGSSAYPHYAVWIFPPDRIRLQPNLNVKRNRLSCETVNALQSLVYPMSDPDVDDLDAVFKKTSPFYDRHVGIFLNYGRLLCAQRDAEACRGKLASLAAMADSGPPSEEYAALIDEVDKLLINARREAASVVDAENPDASSALQRFTDVALGYPTIANKLEEIAGRADSTSEILQAAAVAKSLAEPLFDIAAELLSNLQQETVATLSLNENLLFGGLDGKAHLFALWLARANITPEWILDYTGLEVVDDSSTSAAPPQIWDSESGAEFSLARESDSKASPWKSMRPTVRMQLPISRAIFCADSGTRDEGLYRWEGKVGPVPIAVTWSPPKYLVNSEGGTVFHTVETKYSYYEALSATGQMNERNGAARGNMHCEWSNGDLTSFLNDSDVSSSVFNLVPWSSQFYSRLRISRGRCTFDFGHVDAEDPDLALRDMKQLMLQTFFSKQLAEMNASVAITERAPWEHENRAHAKAWRQAVRSFYVPGFYENPAQSMDTNRADTEARFVNIFVSSPTDVVPTTSRAFQFSSAWPLGELVERRLTLEIPLRKM